MARRLVGCIFALWLRFMGRRSATIAIAVLAATFAPPAIDGFDLNACRADEPAAGGPRDLQVVLRSAADDRPLRGVVVRLDDAEAQTDFGGIALLVRG